MPLFIVYSDAAETTIKKMLLSALVSRIRSKMVLNHSWYALYFPNKRCEYRSSLAQCVFIGLMTTYFVTTTKISLPHYAVSMCVCVLLVCLSRWYNVSFEFVNWFIHSDNIRLELFAFFPCIFFFIHTVNCHFSSAYVPYTHTIIVKSSERTVGCNS